LLAFEKELFPASLARACRHWGSELAFPADLEGINLENSMDIRSFWHSKLPGLQYLHYRKQDILLNQLINGFDAAAASKLLAKRLRLPVTGYGYLLYIDHNKRIQSNHLTHRPASADWSQLVSGMVNSIGGAEPKQLLQNLKDLKQSGGLPPYFYRFFQLAIDGAQGFNSSINSEVIQPLIEAAHAVPNLYINPYERRIAVTELGISFRLQPLQMAYYMSLYELPVGESLGREEMADRVHHWYQRIKSTEQAEIMNMRFNVLDDQTHRQLKSTIRKRFKDAFQQTSYLKWYSIGGSRNNPPQILCPRDKIILDTIYQR
ncbi:MAG: hypothetical protein ACO3GK_09195, partial [Bacteroidia bacterium]